MKGAARPTLATATTAADIGGAGVGWQDGAMRSIPDPGFAGDDGAVDPAVAEALTAYAQDPDRLHAQTLGTLQYARLLVPVVAVLGEVEQDEQGLAHDKTSDMAAVMMRGRDGRNALLAFTGEDRLRQWNPDARPVPVSVTVAAQAAVQDGASALVLDVAGPVLFVVEEDDLQSLADGQTLIEVNGRYGWVRPDR
jgi:hypothetical protein